MNPSTFIPATPLAFIGPARKLAAVLERKAAAMLPEGLPARMLLTGVPGCGKTSLANMFAGLLARHTTSVEAINGRNVTADCVRSWNDAAQYRPITGGFSVKVINELDTATPQAQDLLLSYLDELRPFHAVVATSNQALSGLSERFQSRFQHFRLAVPSAEEITEFLHRFGLNGQSEAIARTCKGNVRAALLDAQSVLDCA
jgi:replication-associated recombination protein RarA